VLIKTVSTERLFFSELSIYRKDDNERINKDFIITETREFINQLKLVDVEHLIKAAECKTFECD
jgi:hypothetical protein